MKNLSLVLKSLLLAFFFLFTCNCLIAQSLKGFTLGAALPVSDRYDSNEDYYIDEKQVTVSGVAGKITSNYYLESIMIGDSQKKSESRYDLEKLTVDEYNAKWGVPKVKWIRFMPDNEYLGVSRMISGVPYYSDPADGGFVKNVMDHYSIKLRFDKIKNHWSGEKGNMRITLDAWSLSLSDIKIDEEIKRRTKEYRSNKAHLHSQDF
ncbi:hypothetical protein SLH46_20790 [Draconibacterium sp. IB214405]|uniref:hypothetical protein n=1 Tax=Draconibacterium sp. IB214405 TaxID=3097352 RepID=UPI002A17E657|nr:hypothetical protein [Draconibacterium sp. IB214405]MDX8341648.1 hypothetical protein [Draconibacterium sp. IB214405]